MGRSILWFFAVTIAATIAQAAPVPFDRYPTSMDDVLARYPPLETNRTAIELENLAARIGIRLAPVKDGGLGQPQAEDTAGLLAVKKALSEYVAAELRRTDAGIAAPPTAVVEFLKLHRDHLDAIREILSRAETPVWEQHLERLWEAPLPYLLGHMQFQRLLIAAALERAAASDSRGALAYIEASWQLNRALRDEPRSIVQAIAVAIARMQAGALRRIPDVPEEWIARLHEHDYRASMTSALWLEGWIWTQIRGASDEEMRRSSWIGKVMLTASAPYMRLCLRDAAEKLDTHLVRLQGIPSLCEGDLATLDRSLANSSPWWSVGTGAIYNGQLGFMGRVARLQLDLEMTSLILGISGVRRKTHELPSALPSPPSTACPSSRWAYTPKSGGKFVLSLEPSVAWPDHFGLILPQRYES